MSKYIIEIEDVPFSKVHIDADGAQNINLYRVKGFSALVFDEHGLDKLTPFDKALNNELEETYQKGFEAGSHEATTLEYQQGLNDAWECAKRIVLIKTDVNCPYFTVDELKKIFGYSTSQNVLRTYSVTEAIEKVKAYEEQQKADEIKVSDIITDGKINYLVIDITDESYVALQGTDFEPVYIEKDYIKSYHNLHDSKDMYKIAEEISKVMKGKQRDCHTCKHQVVSSIECVDCRGFEKWEPKEGE